MMMESGETMMVPLHSTSLSVSSNGIPGRKVDHFTPLLLLSFCTRGHLSLKMTKFSLARLSAVVGVLQLLVAPTQAWMPQKGAASSPKAQVDVSKKVEEFGRQLSTFGVGCIFAASAVAGPSPALADAGKFSYDPNLGGPETWSNLNVEGNQCSGAKQSPIAIRPTACNVGANYEMKVRVDCHASIMIISLVAVYTSFSLE